MRSMTLRQSRPEALGVFKDGYLVEFLDPAKAHREDDLRRGLLAHLKDFLLELGRDFCFVGAEYPVQVGGRDFALGLLFFHRGLNCLVAIELKVERFEPEYPGKLADLVTRRSFDDWHDKSAKFIFLNYFYLCNIMKRCQFIRRGE
jgi:predicted nuclease of restriction endonuclease-like (RecB) superfamily